jgi:trk system potassium uptake protein TrkA
MELAAVSDGYVRRRAVERAGYDEVRGAIPEGFALVAFVEYQQLGLDHVCGTTIVAQVLLEKIQAGHGHHLTHMGDVEVIEFKANNEAEGRRVKDLQDNRRFRVAAIMRGGETFIPEPETVIREGDVITGAVKDDAFRKIQRFMEE